jgi:hypothetical protein
MRLASKWFLDAWRRRLFASGLLWWFLLPGVLCLDFGFPSVRKRKDYA